MKKTEATLSRFLFRVIYRQEDLSPAFKMYHNKNEHTSNQTYAL